MNEHTILLLLITKTNKDVDETVLMILLFHVLSLHKLKAEIDIPTIKGLIKLSKFPTNPEVTKSRMPK